MWTLALNRVLVWRLEWLMLLPDIPDFLQSWHCINEMSSFRGTIQITILEGGRTTRFQSGFGVIRLGRLKCTRVRSAVRQFTVPLCCPLAYGSGIMRRIRTFANMDLSWRDEMAAQIPTEEEVLTYFQKFSNWGRWGDDDELGTPNLITPEKTKRALATVQEGTTVSLARTVMFEPSLDAPAPPVHFMVESGEGWASGDKVSNRPNAAAIDYFGMIFHGYTVTHVDSLAHFFWEGKTYNGKPAHLVSTSMGATVCSVEAARNGFVSRGVLVDVPLVRGIDWLERGEGVMPEDILAAEERCGFRVEEGDILLVRTGQLHRRSVEGPVERSAGSTACQAACLPLFHERGIAVLGSDTGNDVSPAQYSRVLQPIHQVGITAMGLWILDNANLDDVAEACKERNRWEFMVSIGPLRLHNTTGSPVNPIAVF